MAAGDKTDAKAQRLAAALRANLKRRKEQARRRADEGEETLPPPAPDRPAPDGPTPDSNDEGAA